MCVSYLLFFLFFLCLLFFFFYCFFFFFFFYLCVFFFFFFFFFFQAEDGIRDLYVTGVQTCALPISCAPWRSANTDSLPTSLLAAHPTDLQGAQALAAPPLNEWVSADAWYRSEERRVGKECRSRWSPYH